MVNQEWSLFRVFSITSLWWMILFCLGGIALYTIPFTNTFSNYALEQESTLPTWVKRWGNFDGGAYIIISERGYKGVGLLQAYFPVYPLVIGAVAAAISHFIPQTTVGLRNFQFIFSLSFSFVCSVFFFYILNKYLALKYELQQRKDIFISFLFFPTAFFLHAIYTEALFLLLLIFCLYSYKKGWWLRLMGALILLTATRIVGIFMIPALGFDFYLSKTHSFRLWDKLNTFSKHFWQFTAISCGIFGLLSYMLYLYLTFGDPLYFFHVQSSFGAGRQQNLVPFLQVCWRYLKILWTARPFDWKYFAYVQEFVTTGVMLIFLLFGTIKKKAFKLSYAELAFSFGAFFLPTLTGNFSSMSRYVIVCLPIFFILGQIFSQHKTVKIGYIVVCSVLSFINIMLFIQGHWVA
ncbi:MAG: hypothetical protein ABI425_00965 [Patescibacteria group bacterium]